VFFENLNLTYIESHPQSVLIGFGLDLYPGKRERELHFVCFKAKEWVMMYFKLTTCLPVGLLVDIKDLPDF
jgi:hypothetical protein